MQPEPLTKPNLNPNLNLNPNPKLETHIIAKNCNPSPKKSLYNL